MIVVLLGNAPAVIARDDADNPLRPDDLTPAEIAEPEPEEQPWKGDPSSLPPFPRAQDLIPVRGDAGELDYNYYIDVNSVSIGADEVLRYTVVIQSPRGAGNVVYEGIRCATREIKIFAYGTKDGRFERMPDPQWTFIYKKGPLGYRTSLVERYVCDENGWPVDSDTVLERLVMHDPRRPAVVPKEAHSSD